MAQFHPSTTKESVCLSRSSLLYIDRDANGRVLKGLTYSRASVTIISQEDVDRGKASEGHAIKVQDYDEIKTNCTRNGFI